MSKKGIGCLGIILICGLIGSCFSSSDTPKEQVSTPSTVVETNSQPTSTTPTEKNSEKTMEELLAENEQKLKAVEPKRQEMEKHLTTVLSGYELALDKNVTVSDADKPVFAVFPEIIINNISPEQARQEGITIIKKLVNSNMPYTVESYDVTIRDNNYNVNEWVGYTPETNKYYYVEQGGKHVPIK